MAQPNGPVIDPLAVRSDSVTFSRQLRTRQWPSLWFEDKSLLSRRDVIVTAHELQSLGTAAATLGCPDFLRDGTKVPMIEHKPLGARYSPGSKSASRAMESGKPATLFLIALFAAAAPVRVSAPLLSLDFAQAKNANNGNNNGGGNQGGGKGVGSGGDSPGKSDHVGNNNPGNQGKGKTGGPQNGVGDGRRPAAEKPGDSVVAKEVKDDSVQVRYENGFLEQVERGRFTMKDAKGRTIIDRPATGLDRLRLWLKQVTH